MITFIDSFQTYASVADLQRRWVYQYGNGGVPDSGGVLINGSVVSYCNIHTRPLNNFRIGFKFCPRQLATTETNRSFLHLMQGGETNISNLVGLGIRTNGLLEVFYGPNFGELGGTTLAIGTTVLSINTTYWIEMELICSTTTTGKVDLRINGNPEVLLTNIRTAPNSPWITRIGLVAGNNAQHWFSSLYISDCVNDDFLGPSHVYRLNLAADTVQKDFVPSSGTDNYSLLNDLNTATSYVASSTSPARDLYTIESLPVNPYKIHAVQISAEGKEATANSKALQPIVKLDSTELKGNGCILPTTLPAVWHTEPLSIFPIAPDGSAWNTDKVNRLQVGHRVLPFLKGFNFRATAEYVTDPAYCTYVIGDIYPVTRNGVTFGWDNTGATNPQMDRTTSNVLYAGINDMQNTGNQRTFRIDVPTPGRYQLRLLLGDHSFAHSNLYCQVKDGSNVLFTINEPTGTAVLNCRDTAGWYSFAMSVWEEYNTSKIITLTGTTLNVTLGTPTVTSMYSCITHLELIALDYDPTPQTVAPEVQVAGLFTEVLVSSAISGAISTGQPNVMVIT